MRLIIFILAMLILTMQNCSEVTIQPRPPVVLTSKAKGDFCLTPPAAKTKYNNVMFVVDKSGSNSESSPPTDPDKSRRGTALQQFLALHGNDPYYRFGFIHFGGQAIGSYIHDGNDQVPTFDNAFRMQQAINEFYADPDVSGDYGTDYTRALQLVENALINDIQNNGGDPEVEHIYTIFFVSDGMPIESGAPKPITSLNDSRIQQIQSWQNLDAEQVTLHTFYYYATYSQSANDGLALMSSPQAGRGSHRAFQPGDVLEFPDPSVGVLPAAWRIKRLKMVVFNLNSAVCTSGDIGVDSDSDGICDEDEIAYNSDPGLAAALGAKRFNPQNRNALHPDYNDSFVWKFSLLPTGAGLNDCSTNEQDKDFDFLNKCEEGMLYDQNANGPTAQWSIPGNSADPINPDSDGDAFNDWIEFSWFRLDSGHSAAVNYTNIFDYYAPDVNAERLMTEHRSLIKPDEFIHSSYDADLRFIGINQLGENCYNFEQDQLQLYPTLPVSPSQVSNIQELAHGANENKILIYFIATKDDAPNSRGVLFHTIKTLSYTSVKQFADGGIRLTPNLSEFSIYRIPEPD